MAGLETSSHAFTFALDGAGDARVVRALTRSLHEDLGIDSTADPAGLWLRVETKQPINEQDADEIARAALRHGLHLRDRVGTSFVPSATAVQLRTRVQHEWLSRWATAVVFLAPALALHYLTPVIAMGGTLIPSLIEGALVGWSLVAAGFPVIVQGVFSWRQLPRVSPDLLGTVAMLVPFAIGLWMTAIGEPAPPFHASALAILLVSGQRAMIWNRIERLEGSGHLLLPTGLTHAFFLVLGIATLVLDRVGGLAVLLVCPPLLSHLCVNRVLRAPGLLMAVVLFAMVISFSRLVVTETAVLCGRIEAAFIFQASLIILCGVSCGASPGKKIDPGDGVTDNERT